MPRTLQYIALAAWTLVVACAHGPTPPETAEARYRQFAERLSQARLVLDERLAREAPELRASLSPPPPPPLSHGYQLVGQLTPVDLDELKKQPHSGLTASAYSWSVVRGQLDRAEAGLVRFEQALRGELTTLIASYKALVADGQRIEGHIQYNRQWQEQIARFPTHFPNVERWSEKRNPEIRPPRQIRILRPAPNHVVLRVPLFTDIEDAKFVAALKKGIEKFWDVHDGVKRYQVKLAVTRLSPASLYRDGRAPRRGDPIDLHSHIARFPQGGAVVTSGGTTMFAGLTAAGTRFVVLAKDSSELTVAHEFGHVLGLGDAYVRAYRELPAADGYEIHEIIPDHWDIMCAPGEGLVQARHFEAVLEALSRPF